MPTDNVEHRFLHDYTRLTDEQKVLFAAAFEIMVADLKFGNGFRKGLRVKGAQGNKSRYQWFVTDRLRSDSLERAAFTHVGEYQRTVFQGTHITHYGSYVSK